MKNKSKLQKIKQGGKKTPGVPAEWLYLAPEGLELRQVYEALDGQDSWNVEFWEEVQVLEVAVPEAGSLDMERMESSDVDAYLEEYMDIHQLETAYAVTIPPEYYGQMKKVMERIVEKTGGLFCGDTDELQPVIKGV